ncbi:MAG: hypothetical protein OEX08_02920 [Candidatus Nomurabacteria bacterium]|nr:hypothetical protein [Candidatus Nomurabacteria bacterium]
MKNLFIFLSLIIAVLFLFSGCADAESISACTTSNVYGFFGGLWHGIITPFAFIGSLFSDDITIYAVNNSGGWYDFGFLMGVGTWGGGAGAASKRG